MLIVGGKFWTKLYIMVYDKKSTIAIIPKEHFQKQSQSSFLYICWVGREDIWSKPPNANEIHWELISYGWSVSIYVYSKITIGKDIDAISQKWISFIIVVLRNILYSLPMLKNAFSSELLVILYPYVSCYIYLHIYMFS